MSKEEWKPMKVEWKPMWELPQPVIRFGDRERAGVGKLIAKVPMTNQVIDENNTLWEYTIMYGSLLFTRIASVADTY